VFKLTGSVNVNMQDIVESITALFTQNKNIQYNTHSPINPFWTSRISM